MAHFCGILRGNRGEVMRLGTKKSGVVTFTVSWDGAVRSEVFFDDEKGDMLQVELVPWHGKGINRLLYHGPASGGKDKRR